MINVRTRNKVKKAVTNYNAKIRRLSKLGYKNLPKMENVQDLINYNETTKNINARLKELEMFSKRGIEKTVKTNAGVETSEYQIRLIKSRVKRAKLSLGRKLRYYQTQGNYKRDDRYYNALGKLNVLEKTDYNYLTKEDFLLYPNKVSKMLNYNQGNVSMFRNSFISTLERAKVEYNLKDDEIDKIRKELIKLDDEQFEKMYEENQSVRNILELYPEASFDEEYIETIEDNISSLSDIIKDLVKQYGK